MGREVISLSEIKEKLNKEETKTLIIEEKGVIRLSWSFGYIYICKQLVTMAPHSSTLAWQIPWAEEPGRLQSMASLGVGHD